jgi:hypothetical protein
MANVRSDRAVKVEAMKLLDRVVVDNQFFKPIEAKGGKLIAVYLTLKNTGTESGNMAWSSFILEDSQGRKYATIDDSLTQNKWLEEQGLEPATAQLFPGGTSKTGKIFRVAADAKKLKLIVNDKSFKLPPLQNSINTRVISSTDDIQSDRDRDTERNLTAKDDLRQEIESSSPYQLVKAKAEAIYNNAAQKNEHDRMCEQARMLLSTGSSDAEKVNAFCLAVDAYIQKKMTQKITTAIGSSESSQGNISRDDAIATIEKYLKAKPQLYAPPFDKNLGAELLTGKFYQDKIDKNNPECENPDDCLSSIDWLIKYDAYYTYGVRRIDSIDSFESSGNHATLTLTITESRTLHQGGKQKRTGETSKTTFDLVNENGLIKIADIRSK